MSVNTSLFDGSRGRIYPFFNNPHRQLKLSPALKMVRDQSRFGTFVSFLCPCLFIAILSCCVDAFVFRQLLWFFYPIFYLLPVWHFLLITLFPLWKLWKFASFAFHNANRGSRVILDFLSLFFVLTIQLAPSPQPVSAFARIWWSTPDNSFVIQASELKVIFLTILLNPYLIPFLLIWKPSFSCFLVLDSNHSYLLLPNLNMSGPPQHPPPPPVSRLPPSTVSYAEHTPDESVLCPICHDPVVAESVIFSCHKHVPYCADCVATWVWRCVTTYPRLSGYPTCPHCRSLVAVDETFRPNRGRWLKEHDMTGSAGAAAAAASTASDRDWYDRYLLDLVSESMVCLSRDIELYNR